MANTNFIQLPAAIGLTGAETVAVVQAGVDKKTTTGDIAALGLELYDMPAETVLANITGITAQPLPVSISAILDTIGSAQGSLLFRGASDWSVLPPSTAGRVLATQGAGADPAWTGSTTTAAGSTTQIQFNTAGALDASAAFTFATSGSTNTVSIGTAGATSGAIALSGSTSGTVSVKMQAAAGTYNFNLPT